MTDVADCLRPPGVPAGFADPLAALNAAGDVLSPGSWLLKLAELVLPEDPVAWAQRQLAGDWETYARCAEAWRRTGHACRVLARDVGAGRGRAAPGWQGNAADAAFAYFDALRADLLEFHHALAAMGEEYVAVAQAVAATANAVGECVSAIADALVTAALAAAASTALGWTGCAALMGYALGAEEARVILREWERMTRLVNAAQLAVNAGYGAMGRAGGQALARLHAFPLPRDDYDHPAVTVPRHG
ncbi:hypothetical protein GCM10010218_55170 [Streptomyces mashuensis]|uniref:Uncharacterized protein n=1 Tax=Streptomyces mashuensis TaxID=33904 RepID=A0A919B7L1_9ACTN|nr:hypothetical protein [Streptomyces mashuensis]GHF66555.1 hypothetical protein GCM10010218_55170 [Streptomyces mashuensis]